TAAIIARLDPETGETSILTRLKESIESNDASLLSIQAIADDSQSDFLYILDSCNVTLTSRVGTPVYRIKKVDKISGEVSWFYPESQDAQTALIDKAKEAWNASNDIEDVREQF